MFIGLSSPAANIAPTVTCVLRQMAGNVCTNSSMMGDTVNFILFCSIITKQSPAARVGARPPKPIEEDLTLLHTYITSL